MKIAINVKNKIDGIIFDLGGVVIESFEFDFYKDAGKKLAISPDRLAKVSEDVWSLVELDQETNGALWRRVAGKLGLGASTGKVLASLWLKHYRLGAKIKPDTLAVVKKLQGKYVLGVISNTQKEHSAINRQRGLFRYFDVVILSNEVGFRKPQKEVFELASAGMEIPFSRLLFIDDNMRWVRVARKYGLKALLFARTIKERSEEDEGSGGLGQAP